MSAPSAAVRLLLVTATACASGGAGTLDDMSEDVAPAPVVCDVQHAGDDTSHVFTMKEVDKQAHPIRGTNFKPLFELLPPRGTRFALTFRVVVDTLGRPDPCRAVVGAESESGLGADALEEMLKWRFVPAIRGGRKVPELLVVTLKSRNVIDWYDEDDGERQR